MERVVGADQEVLLPVVVPVAVRHAVGGAARVAVPGAADRAENVRRVGEVARLMADAGLVVLVPVISPYRKDRDAVRRAHVLAGLSFAEVHVATPLEECETRDPKGLYAKARAGELSGFTGIDDPYEEPLAPEARIGEGEPLDESIDLVMDLVAWFAEAEPE